MSSIIVKELKINFYEFAWKSLIKLLKETGMDHQGMIKKALDSARDEMFKAVSGEFQKIAEERFDAIGKDYINAMPKVEKKE